jgi:hypothetical protein
MRDSRAHAGARRTGVVAGDPRRCRVAGRTAGDRRRVRRAMGAAAGQPVRAGLGVTRRARCRGCPTRRWPTRSPPACCGGCGRRRLRPARRSCGSRTPPPAGPPTPRRGLRAGQSCSTLPPGSPASCWLAPASRSSCTRTSTAGTCSSTTRGAGLRSTRSRSSVSARSRDPDPRARVRRRLDQLAEELGLDRERLRGWAIVHAVAWGGEPGGDWYPDMVACAGWLADAA